jgi:hypothetical protein
MKKIQTISICGLLLIFIISSCTDNENGDPTPNNLITGELLIINNTANANATDALQSVYTDSSNKYKSYCYGSFSSDGKPDRITQMVVNKIAGDTSLNIFFDDSMRVKSLFLTVAGVKNNSLLTFDYSVSGKVILSSYFIDFASDSSKLTDQIVFSTLENGSYSIDGYTSFKKSQNNNSSNKHALLETKTERPFMIKFVFASAALPVLNAIILTSTTGIGCLIGGFPGCVVGGIIAEYLVTRPASANASEISSLPTYAPSSPNVQTQGTQLSTKKIFIGTTLRSGLVYFTGYCNYAVEYFNTSFEIKLDNTGQNILSSNVNSTMAESIVGSCSQPNPAPSQRNSYFLNNFSISGNNITINFGQSAFNFPQNNAVFVGTISDSIITGIFTLSRTSNGLNCVVNIPATLKQIN